MDGDGFKDLILGSQLTISSEAGIIRVFKGSATGPTTTQMINKTLSGGHKVIVHDLNNDGKNDLISVSFNINEDYFGALINTSGPPPCTPPTISFASNAALSLSSMLWAQVTDGMMLSTNDKNKKAIGLS